MGNTSFHRSKWIPDDFEKGLVSVIIPSYNRAHIITEALDSVWAQSYRPIELIVVDDGSIDDTGSIVESWRDGHQGDDQFELYYFRQENSGVCSARNLGLLHSNGEYIQFLDSDDAFYPNMVAQTVRVFKETHSNFVLVGYDKVCGECGRAIQRYVPEPDTDALTVYMKGELWGNSISVARRRHLIQEIGPWDTSLLNDADGNYLVRTILKSPRMAVVSERLFVYYVRRGPRLSDQKGSSKSWQCYVDRETMFCEGIKGRADLSSEAKGEYAERLYKLALSHYNSGLPEIGTAFGDLAEGIQGAALTGRGKLMQRSWRSGRRAYAGYEWLREKKHQIRRFLSGKPKKESTCPVCGG